MFLDRRCIIFDLDGTLVDSLSLWSSVDQTLIERLSADHVRLTEPEAYALRWEAMQRYGEGSSTYIKLCAEMKARFGMKETPEEIHRQRYEIAREFGRTRLRYREGAPEVLRAMKAAGLTLAIATTTRRRNIVTYAEMNEALIAAAPLYDYFGDLIYSRDDVERVKPDPEVYERILEKTGFAPEECLVVEDAAAGMIGARAAGIGFVGPWKRSAPLGALEAGLSFSPSFDQTLSSRIGGPRAALGLPEGGFASETSASERRADRTARRGEDDDEKAKRLDG